MKQILSDIVKALEQGKELVIAVVCNHSGSTPRSSGAKMAVYEDGSIAGTIGGGIVEKLAMDAARDMFSGTGGQLKSFNLTGQDAAASGMICGGRMQVFLDRVSPGPDTLALYTATLQALEKGAAVTLLTGLGADAGPEFPGPLQRWLLVDGRAPDGLPAPPPALAEQGRDRFHRQPGAAIHEVDNTRVLIEDLLLPGDLFFLGAGHVAQQTAELAASVGFRVVVMDDRRDFANSERFPGADRIKVLSSFDDCFRDETIDQDSYLVIVTRGHLKDKEVLGQALATNAWYVGMIGSKSKRKAVYQALKEEGVSQEAIDRVHCPIGLSIGADTPREIAVSIVAELISERARRRSSHA